MNIHVLHGDITQQAVDVIVNAANKHLVGGGGVDGAIHRAAGSVLAEACKKIGHCDTGQAVITPAGSLSCRYVIHAVGPVWQGGGHKEAALLQSAYEHSLTLAEAHACKSMAFPNISTGVYGYPKDLAAEVALRTVRAYGSSGSSVETLYFVCFDEENLAIYRERLTP